MDNETNDKSPLLPSTHDDTRQINNKNYINNNVANPFTYDSIPATPPTGGSNSANTVVNPSSNNYPNNKNYVTQREQQQPSSSSSREPSPMTKVSGNRKMEPEVKLYKRRWYILAMFSLWSNVQTAVWTTWGPIANSSERVFGWTDSTIAWLNNCGPISYMVAGILFPLLLHAKGLRAAILGSALLVSFGCTFRVISSDPSTGSILIHIGQILNGAAGPMAMGAMPYLSATWFPVNERVTATAIATSVGYFGTAVSFVLGPCLVSDSDMKFNGTNGTDGSSLLTVNNTDLDAIIDKEKGEIMNYMYYSCGVAWLITIIILIYFPARPSNPPCISAVVQRDTFWGGILSLRKKKYFIFIAVTYGLSIGVLNMWLTVLTINLGKFDVSQSKAGWIGFYATVASCVTSIAVGKFANHFARLMKVFILVLYVIGASFFIVFTLMFIGVIPYSNVLLYVTVICGSTAINGAIPLMFELACELAFPTGEGSANGVLTYINNIFGLLFMALFAIPGIGRSWMNWILVGAIVFSLPLVGLLKGHLKRLEIDEKEERSVDVSA